MTEEMINQRRDGALAIRAGDRDVAHPGEGIEPDLCLGEHHDTGSLRSSDHGGSGRNSR